MKNVLGVIAIVLACMYAFAEDKPAPRWDAWQFLQGKWVGEGSSEMGNGTGYFTFEPDLQNKTWLRRNYSEYPATKDHAKYVHEDLMIVYFDRAAQQTRAFYVDTEGHAIQYTPTWSNDGNTLTFLSDATTTGPRFRLTYVKSSSDHMSLTLEVAQPDKPNEFRKVVEGKVRKVPS